MDALRRGAVVAGHICLDIIPELPNFDPREGLAPGTVTEIGPSLLALGGAVANTGRSLKRLGIETSLMGKLGDDALGRITLDLLRQDDPALAADMMVSPGEVSSYTLVLDPPAYDRSFLHCPGANHTFGLADVNFERVAQARLFHFGYPPVMRRMYQADGAELAAIYQRAKASGAITSLDMALPDPDGPGGQVNWRAVLANTLPHVDFFLPSEDELLFMLGRRLHEDHVISDMAAEALAMGAQAVGIKLGARGFYLRTGDQPINGLQDEGWRQRELWVPCFEAQPLVGTTGAGDATIAGFLAALLHGQDIIAAMTSAVAVGACNVEAADALSGVRPWPETQARITAGWPRLPLEISAPGWHPVAEGSLVCWAGPSDQARR